MHLSEPSGITPIDSAWPCAGDGTRTRKNGTPALLIGQNEPLALRPRGSVLQNGKVTRKTISPRHGPRTRDRNGLSCTFGRDRFADEEEERRE